VTGILIIGVLVAILIVLAIVAIALRQRLAEAHEAIAAAERRSADSESLRAQEAVQGREQLAEAERRENALTARIARLSTSFNLLPIPVWRRDRELRVTDCNRAFAVALDATPETVLAAGQELGGRQLAELALTAKTPQSETMHKVIGGARRLLEVTELPHADGGTVGVALDMTDREDAQTTLERHVSAHGGVLENLGTAIAIFGADTRLKFFNGAYTRLWRLEENWLRTQPEYGEVLEMLRERRRLPEYADFRAFKRGALKLFTSLVEPLEDLIYIPDGTTLRTRVAPHPLGGLLFTYEDVTDILVLERSYNTLIAVQRETLDHLYEGVVVIGADGRIKLTNPVYARMWGLPPDMLAGEPHITEIVDRCRPFFKVEGDWPSFRDRVIARFTGRVARNGRLFRTDGTVLDYAAVPLPDGGVLQSYLDVTDKLRVENALLERAEALEAADRLKSEFVSNVSYELRTPLNTINGFAGLLAQQYFGQLNERQRGYTTGILESAERLSTIIDNILDLASLEAGRMSLEYGAVDAHALLGGVAALMHEPANGRGLSLEVDCPTDLAPFEGDERRLKQALCNLVSNSIKFSSTGGAVKLAARQADANLLISVADAGLGIAPEDQQRVFNAFERGAGAGPQSGAGLGLALVKRIIELHGGKVTIDSEPNRGTLVTCVLPMAASPAAEPPAAVIALSARSA
jgi:signal transduction histidine kinase